MALKNTDPAEESRAPVDQSEESLGIEEKYGKLRRILSSIDGAVIAFSGGVDSSLLLAVAAETIPGRLVAVTSISPLLPRADKELAQRIATDLGVEHLLIETQEMSDPSFVANGPRRCFHCKMGLFTTLWQIAAERGYETVLEGSNLDDQADYRPGHQAGRTLGVQSPLMQSGLTKADVRALAKMLGLENADKPSSACLASRIPYGERITKERLERIEAAERVLQFLGIEQVRVRDHGSIARIEVPEAVLPRLMDLPTRKALVNSLQDLGWVFVTLDMEGYSVGSMNKIIATQTSRDHKKT